MTRINAGINPASLTRQHLLAEHREIKRIPNMVASGRANLTNIPEVFTLGTGHVKFFYNKLGYLLSRYRSIYSECVRRGYNVTDYTDAWSDIPSELMNDWQPSRADAAIVAQRIRSKLVA